jgi:hypothetical protein
MTADITVNGLRHDTVIGGSYKAELHSNPIELGTFRSDANGDIHAAITIPSNVTPGVHTLHLYGKNTANEDIDIQTVVYVVDENGRAFSGSCQIVPDSGEDYDKDGVDDACDGNITEPPVVVTTNPIPNTDDTHTTTFDPSFAVAQSLAAGNTIQTAVTTDYFQSTKLHGTAIDAPTGAETTGHPAVLGASKPGRAQSAHRIWTNWLTAALLALGLAMLVLRGITVRSRP